MNKIAVAASALALLGFASVANAGDMKDQGPINDTYAVAAQPFAAPDDVNGDIYPVIIRNVQKPAFLAHAAGAPSTSQIAQNLQGLVYEAPAQ